MKDLEDLEKKIQLGRAKLELEECDYQELKETDLHKKKMAAIGEKRERLKERIQDLECAET